VAKAGGKFSRYRAGGCATVRGKPVIFDPNSEYAIEARLEEAAERLQREMEARLRQATADPPPKRQPRKPQRQPAQEEIRRKVREKYPPDGDVGDSSVAAARRMISSKGFNPGWDSVNRALGRARKK
jgi:hypothetical protein